MVIGYCSLIACPDECDGIGVDRFLMTGWRASNDLIISAPERAMTMTHSDLAQLVSR